MLYADLKLEHQLLYAETVDYINQSSLNRANMAMWEAIEMLNSLVDESDLYHSKMQVSVNLVLDSLS